MFIVISVCWCTFCRLYSPEDSSRMEAAGAFTLTLHMLSSENRAQFRWSTSCLEPWTEKQQRHYNSCVAEVLSPAQGLGERAGEVISGFVAGCCLQLHIRGKHVPGLVLDNRMENVQQQDISPPFSMQSMSTRWCTCCKSWHITCLSLCSYYCLPYAFGREESALSSFQIKKREAVFFQECKLHWCTFWHLLLV